GRGFFQDLLFHLQRAHLLAQTAQLLALLGREALALALVDLRLAAPFVQRLVRAAELFGDRLDGSGAQPQQLERFTPELRRVRRSRSRHLNLLGSVFRPKRSGVLESGGTPERHRSADWTASHWCSGALLGE